MARSSYIYVVVDGQAGPEPGDRDVTAAFTVKHELVSWLHRQPSRDIPWLTVARCLDGLSNTGKVSSLRAREVLEGKRWPS